MHSELLQFSAHLSNYLLCTQSLVFLAITCCLIGFLYELAHFYRLVLINVSNQRTITLLSIAKILLINFFSTVLLLHVVSYLCFNIEISSICFIICLKYLFRPILYPDYRKVIVKNAQNILTVLFFWA